MKLLLVASFFLVIGCSGGGTKRSAHEIKPVATESLKNIGLELSIQGMTCTGCEKTIQSGLSSIKGVVQIKADYKSGKAYVECIQDFTDTIRMRESVTSSGYILANIKSVPIDSLRLKQ